jgi:hypothetical protein
MPDLTRPTPLVYPVIHLIPDGLVDIIRIRSVADIAEVVRDRHVDSLTSADGRLDFWFSFFAAGISSPQPTCHRTAAVGHRIRGVHRAPAARAGAFGLARLVGLPRGSHRWLPRSATDAGHPQLA